MSRTNYSFFAPAPLNMEDLLESEIKNNGGVIKRIHRTGIEFSGFLEAGYRLCLWSRIAGRVLLPILETESSGPEDLYSQTLKIPWEEHLKTGASFAIDSTAKGEFFTDARFASLKLKDAIVDSMRNRTGDRPEIDTDTPGLRLNLNIRDRKVIISLDLAGDGLHKRGYRTSTGPAPLRENTAAAILIRAGWPETAAQGGGLVDPMCGSGTFLIEGAMIAGDIAPGLLHRNFGFYGWKDHDEKLWIRLREEAENRKAEGAGKIPPIRGFDRNPDVVASAWENIKNAGLEKRIHVEKQDLSDLKPTAAMEKPGLVAVNPPYGKRLEENSLLAPLYRLLGDQLRSVFPGWKAVMITSDENLARETALKPDRTNIMFNGPLRCVVNRYSIFSKSQRNTMEEREKTLSPGARMFANRLKKKPETAQEMGEKRGSEFLQTLRCRYARILCSR